MIKESLILRVHHAQITIPDGAEDEARKFYCDILGLREVAKPEILRTRGGFWLEAGGFQIHIGTENGFDRRKSKSHIAYEEKICKTGAKNLSGTMSKFWKAFRFQVIDDSNFATLSEIV